ncbi:hypothetical protein ACLKA6_001219 [Drosophila palustris]
MEEKLNFHYFGHFDHCAALPDCDEVVIGIGIVTSRDTYNCQKTSDSNNDRKTSKLPKLPSTRNGEKQMGRSKRTEVHLSPIAIDR